jgi:two-component system, NarL family, nitrate/nitrite response regulator NarL
MAHPSQAAHSPSDHALNTREKAGAVEDSLREYLHAPEAARAGDARDGELLRLCVDGIDYAVVRCAPEPASARMLLSPREQAIVRLIIKGYSNKTLARVLEISPWTVATHLRRIFAKLDVGSRSEMVAHVLRGNLLALDPGDMADHAGAEPPVRDRTEALA